MTDLPASGYDFSASPSDPVTRASPTRRRIIILYLQTRGLTPRSQIATDLNLTHFTVLTILDTLDDRDLLDRQNGRVHVESD